MAFLDSYVQLPASFYTRLNPTPVAAPRLLKFNRPLAEELGLELAGADDAELAQIFSGNRLLPGSQPLAMVYAGHQFGNFVPRLGDGRAILLGEVRDRFGRLRDIQLKGSGRTPYSRGGDGRAAIGPVLREYLVSEAMAAMQVPTTRSLAAVASGEAVLREEPLPGAILTRVAASHVRIGTFQYFAAQGDADAVRRLADYVIERHYPDVAPTPAPYVELLRAVMRAQARLVAAWMNLGFIHGVMNTDNMAVSGETIDFGPCAFLDTYDPAAVFSSIDVRGRYAYQNQPAAAQWNLARFAETLLPLMAPSQEAGIELATAVLEEFPSEFERQRLAGMRRKLGLFTEEEGDAALAAGLLEAMHRTEADFTVTFRALCAAAPGGEGPAGLTEWLASWRTRTGREPGSAEERAAAMRAANPAIIPRNHRIEAVIQAAIEHDDTAPFEELAAALRRPFEEVPAFLAYAEPPLPAERVLQTFCGT